MNIEEVLKKAIELDGSDLFLVPGSHMLLKTEGRVVEIGEERIFPEQSETLIEQIYNLADRDMETLKKTGDDDFSFSLKDVGRFRCNAYKQRNSLATVIRIVKFGLPDSEKLHIPNEVIDLYSIRNGLILVTGPAGSGKTTTLACLIDRINTEREGHIITLEDPIEFIHRHKKSIVTQREIGHDTESYSAALRAALRQTPDVILLGEMRDFTTIQTALTAAETGQLVISTLHTVGAAKSIDRIVDVFPAAQQSQIRLQLSMVLRAVISQQLLPTTDGKIVPAFEILIVNPAIRNMIREGKIHQLDNVMFAGKDTGMRTMDSDITRLYKDGVISKETALAYAVDFENMERRLH